MASSRPPLVELEVVLDAEAQEGAKAPLRVASMELEVELGAVDEVGGRRDPRREVALAPLVVAREGREVVDGVAEVRDPGLLETPV
eukprot:14168480-Alexandrium_andersonii.AAC.1